MMQILSSNIEISSKLNERYNNIDISYFKDWNQKQLDQSLKDYEVHKKMLKGLLTDPILQDGLRRYLVDYQIHQELVKKLRDISDWKPKIKLNEKKFLHFNQKINLISGEVLIKTDATHIKIPDNFQFECLEMYCDNCLIWHYDKNNLVIQENYILLPVPIVKEKANQSDWIARFYQKGKVIKTDTCVELYHQDIQSVPDHIPFQNIQSYKMIINQYQDIHNPSGINNLRLYSGKIKIKLRKSIYADIDKEIILDATHNEIMLQLSHSSLEIVNTGEDDVKFDIYVTNVFIYHNNKAGIRLMLGGGLYMGQGNYKCQCEYKYQPYIKHYLHTNIPPVIKQIHPNISKYLRYMNPLNPPNILGGITNKYPKTDKYNQTNIQKYLFQYLSESEIIKYQGRKIYIFTFSKSLPAIIHKYDKIVFYPYHKTNKKTLYNKRSYKFVGIIQSERYHYQFPILENAEKTKVIEISDFFTLRIQEYVKTKECKIITHGSCISRAYPGNSYLQGNVTSYQKINDNGKKIDISTSFNIDDKKNKGLKVKRQKLGISINKFVWAYKITYHKANPCLVEIKIPRSSPIAGRPNDNKYRTRDIEVTRMWYLTTNGNSKKYYIGNIAPISYARHDSRFSYQLGKSYSINNYDGNLNAVCRAGIHFCLTPEECVRYMLHGTFPQNQQITTYHIIDKKYHIDIIQNILTFL